MLLQTTVMLLISTHFYIHCLSSPSLICQTELTLGIIINKLASAPETTQSHTHLKTQKYDEYSRVWGKERKKRGYLFYFIFLYFSHTLIFFPVSHLTFLCTRALFWKKRSWKKNTLNQWPRIKTMQNKRGCFKAHRWIIYWCHRYCLFFFEASIVFPLWSCLLKTEYLPWSKIPMLSWWL